MAPRFVLFVPAVVSHTCLLDRLDKTQVGRSAQQEQLTVFTGSPPWSRPASFRRLSGIGAGKPCRTPPTNLASHYFVTPPPRGRSLPPPGGGLPSIQSPRSPLPAHTLVANACQKAPH